MSDKIKTYAKINLGLEIVGKRENGYHNIETIFQTIDFYDEIEIDINLNKDEISIECNNKQIPTDNRNILFKVYELFKLETNLKFGLKLFINKNIPIGGGLGGGSSNAAGLLKYLNNYFDNILDYDKIYNIAIKLGADVPYFLVGGTVFAEGIGEILHPIKDLSAQGILIFPKVGVNTKWAYSKIDLSSFSDKLFNLKNIRDLIEQEKFTFKRDILFNRFESIVFNNFEEIKEEFNYFLKFEEITELRMSGSGSTLFGIVDDNVDINNFMKKIKNDKKNVKKFKFMQKKLEKK